MVTLTYGRKRPETNDEGSDFFPALEDNITLDDAHSHNGVNSTLLTGVAVTKFTSTISSGSWTGSAGVYSQNVDTPVGLSGAASNNDVNNYGIEFYITSTGVRVWPSVTRVDANTYTVVVNDNSLNLTAIYT